MPRRRKRPSPGPPSDPPPQPLPDPALTLPPPSEEETVEDLIERAARIKRTSDALIHQMKELAAQIEQAKDRRKGGR